MKFKKYFDQHCFETLFLSPVIKHPSPPPPSSFTSPSKTPYEVVWAYNSKVYGIAPVIGPH